MGTAVDVVVSHLHPTLGMEKATLALIQLLKDRGADLRVIVLAGTEADMTLAQSAVIVGGARRGVRRLSLTSARRARGVLRSDAAAIYVGVWVAVPMLIVSFLRRPRRVIVWEHSLVREKWSTSRGLNLLKWAAKALYPRADIVVCVSDLLARDVSDLCPKSSVTTIPNIIDESEGPSTVGSRSSDDFTLLMIGSLSATKNQALAIRAVAALPGVSLRLRIAGDGSTRASLEQLAADLGVGDRVDFLGHLAAVDVGLELGRCDCVVHTAVGETFGYVYFEAAAADRPLVAVHNRLIGSVIPRFAVGRVCEASVGALSSAISEVANTHFRSEDYMVARRNRRDYFGEAAIGDQWMAVLR